ncbi:DUF1488 domain-containing protein [Pararobbsia alpina]|jgi:hypothetical protein|uniref:DUF1488 domain-containing protein n=1 Tax=Pararobbsia alpina TaxID=621374 RepID=A0A6S7BLL5_9BURK|nr:DUF1488 domain-containing protein [Pararobbsia alpina]CAB3792697.1 hypothetical protein LMG28138_03376 [Pararobbsia alpina]
MRIEFPAGKREWNGAELMVDFVATVDGATVLCSISAEALEDHFGAPSPLEADMLSAFDGHVRRIHLICRRTLEGSGGEPVVLRSGLIRVFDARNPPA